MPELPEVHTTVTGLQKKIQGLVIQSMWSQIATTTQPHAHNHKNKDYVRNMGAKIKGQKIESVTRRGKYILINLSSQEVVLIHLRMTGHLIFGNYILDDESKQEWPWIPTHKNTPLSDNFNRHIRAVFTLVDAKGKENHLVFCDMRKFGTIELLSPSALTKKLAKLGPEPLETAFTLSLFQERIRFKKTSAIKTALLDQTVLVGVGNIYSDEALHLAQIKPTRKIQSLTKQELFALYTSIQKILRSGIGFGGDSMSDYRNVDGERGAFQGEHNVYLRQKKPCTRKGCLGVIEKISLGGRGTHYCPVCQY
jgi:formamidopyrimidine-DNA glycosylase